jgi:hypothetical protein
VAAAAEARDDREPAPLVQRDQADTAALLRELSSLGFGDDSSRPAPPPTTTPRQAPPTPDTKKKRKGLFSRG